MKAIYNYLIYLLPLMLHFKALHQGMQKIAVATFTSYQAKHTTTGTLLKYTHTRIVSDQLRLFPLL